MPVGSVFPGQSLDWPNRIIKHPHLARLARSGVRFDSTVTVAAPGPSNVGGHAPCSQRSGGKPSDAALDGETVVDAKCLL